MQFWRSELMGLRIFDVGIFQNQVRLLKGNPFQRGNLLWNWLAVSVAVDKLDSAQGPL